MTERPDLGGSSGQREAGASLEGRDRSDDEQARTRDEPAGPFGTEPTDADRTASLDPIAPADSRRRAGPTTPPAAGSAPPAAPRPPRRARLTLRRIDPWSVMKFTMLFAAALLVVFVVAVAVLYGILDGMGVFDSVNETLLSLTDSGGEDSTGGIQAIFAAPRIIGGAAVLGAINVILVTALTTLAAFLYNLCADLVGGIDVTLGERE